jgi:hypothetical protein
MVTKNFENKSLMQPMCVFLLGGHGRFYGCLGLPIFSFLLVSSRRFGWEWRMKNFLKLASQLVWGVLTFHKDVGYYGRVPRGQMCVKIVCFRERRDFFKTSLVDGA